MATYYTYDSAGNVETTWTVTQPYAPLVNNVWNVTITDSSGSTILDQDNINPGIDLVLLQLLGTGYVLTPGSGDFTVLISALSAQTFVSTLVQPAILRLVLGQQKLLPIISVEQALFPVLPIFSRVQRLMLLVVMPH